MAMISSQGAKTTTSWTVVPASTIRDWMDKCRHDLTVEDILNYRTSNDS